MDTPETFELANGYARYDPAGKVTLLEALTLVSVAIAYAREKNIKLLLVDTTLLTGFDPPTAPELFSVGGQLARSGQGAVKVAIIARPEMIDPEKFAIVVANNRGLQAEAFTTETEALTWLLSSFGEQGA